MELLIKLNLYEIIIVSIATSIGVETVKYFVPNAKTKIILPLITLLFTVLRIFPLETISFSEPSKMIFNFILTVSFTILFYKYGGERIVKFIVGSVTSRIENTSKNKENEPFE